MFLTRDIFDFIGPQALWFPLFCSAVASGLEAQNWQFCLAWSGMFAIMWIGICGVYGRK